MRTRTRILDQDVLFGLSIISIGILFLAVLIPYGIQAPQRAVPYAALSPYFLPRIMAALLILMGLIVSALSLVARAKRRDEAAREADNAYRALPDALWRCLGACFLFLVYYVAIPRFGLTVSSVIGWIALALLYGETRIVVLFLGSVGLSAALYLFFTQVAQVPLPVGSLFYGA